MPRPEIDWLSVTILYREGSHIDPVYQLDLQTVLDLFNIRELKENFVPMKGIHRYRARYSFQGITINEPDPERLIGDGTQEKSGMGYNVCLSGKGLDFFCAYQQKKAEEKHKRNVFNLSSFLRALINNPLYRVHCSRIDIAIDDRINKEKGSKVKCLLDLDTIHHCATSGNIETRIRNFNFTQVKQYKFEKGSETGVCKVEPAGETLYFGSRQSEKYIRIYDKLAEQREKDPENKELEETLHWVRFEVEYKGDTAGEILKMYVVPNSGEWEKSYLSHVRDMVNFTENGETAPWWEKFCQEFGPVHLSVPRKRADTGEYHYVRNSFFKQMGRKALTVLLGDGPKNFLNALLSVAPKLEKKHYSVLKGYCLDMQLDGQRGFKLLPTVDENGELQQLELSFDQHSVGFLRETCSALKETRERLRTGDGLLPSARNGPDDRFSMTADEFAAMMYSLGVNGKAWR